MQWENCGKESIEQTKGMNKVREGREKRRGEERRERERQRERSEGRNEMTDRDKLFPFFPWRTYQLWCV